MKIRYNICKRWLPFESKGVNLLLKEELMKISVEEFSRLQKWMATADKDSETYGLMYDRYKELKVILASLNVNATELDMIK